MGQSLSVARSDGYKLNGITPYYAAMLSKLREVAAHKGMIGQGELAAALKVNVTKSFRRAVRQAEIDGYVTKAYYYGANGGRCVGFEVHTDLVQLRLPFEDGHPF